jgi:hypothetical protein
MFSQEINRLDNDENILDLLDMLVIKYSKNGFALYLDKILMILSKNLRNKYEKHIDIKRTLTI